MSLWTHPMIVSYITNARFTNKNLRDPLTSIEVAKPLFSSSSSRAYCIQLQTQMKPFLVMTL